MLTSVQLTYQLEKAIRDRLIDLHREVRGISSLNLYYLMQEQFPTENLTTGFFNKIISDMKRTGIVYEPKGSSLLYLTEAAYGVVQKGVHGKYSGSAA